MMVNLPALIVPVRLLSLLLMLSCVMQQSPAFGQQERQPPPEITEMMGVFRARTVELAKQYETKIQSLPQQYQRDIRTLHNLYQQKGDLDGVLATAREIKRFDSAIAEEHDPFELTPEMPYDAIVAKPAELRKLQQQYMKSFKEAADLRLHEVRDLVGKYLARLQMFQADFTRSGRIADAVYVKMQSERLQKSIKEGNIIPITEQMASEMIRESRDQKTASDATVDADIVPTFGNVPNWTKWQFSGRDRFARKRTQYAHPDLPDELSVAFSKETGRGRFYGRCRAGSKQIDVALSRWFGKALVWDVADVETLTATFILTSKHISAGEEHGPAVQLAILVNETPLQAINVNLYEHETKLRLVKDPKSNRCALMWPRGSITETFELPENGKISVLLGVTVRNPGELCDTSLVIQ